MSMRTSQKGLSLVGLLLYTCILSVSVMFGIRFFSLYYEKIIVTKALDQLASTPEIARKNSREIMQILIRQLNEIADLERFNEQSMNSFLKIVRNQDRRTRLVTLSYQADQLFIGDIWLTLKYSKSISIPGNGNEWN